MISPRFILKFVDLISDFSDDELVLLIQTLRLELKLRHGKEGDE